MSAIDIIKLINNFCKVYLSFDLSRGDIIEHEKVT